jgi:hypothetical protein
MVRTSAAEGRHGPLPAGEFTGPGRPGRGTEDRRQPGVSGIDVNAIDEVLGGAGADANRSVDAHLTSSPARMIYRRYE